MTKYELLLDVGLDLKHFNYMQGLLDDRVVEDSRGRFKFKLEYLFTNTLDGRKIMSGVVVHRVDLSPSDNDLKKAE